MDDGFDLVVGVAAGTSDLKDSAAEISRPGNRIIIQQPDHSFIVLGRGSKLTATGTEFVGIETAIKLSATDLAPTRISTATNPNPDCR
ncbi:hypothetical protein [Pseudarthrobacter sp. SSS035]|uniref:hypothetical protein n=1 Tax=Pseudarthrobacter sp. SSS035 TaxID=2931399 RepID=UPI00200F8ED6|nr:hypothetical protein [Pseudarthrobacter sp. SSS035]